MKIHEVVGVHFDGSFGLYAARNEDEVKLLVGMIQDQGGMPLVCEREVLDDFNMFALDPVSHEFAEPSMN